MIDYVCEKPLARGHYFFDGNKRTAVMATYTFLMKNGYELIVSNETLFEVCISIYKGSMNEKELTTWLKNNSYDINDEKLTSLT